MKEVIPSNSSKRRAHRFDRHSCTPERAPGAVQPSRHGAFTRFQLSAVLKAIRHDRWLRFA